MGQSRTHALSLSARVSRTCPARTSFLTGLPSPSGVAVTSVSSSVVRTGMHRTQFGVQCPPVAQDRSPAASSTSQFTRSGQSCRFLSSDALLRHFPARVGIVNAYPAPFLLFSSLFPIFHKCQN